MTFLLLASALLMMALSFILYGFLPSVKRRHRQTELVSVDDTQRHNRQQQLNVSLYQEQLAALDLQRDSGGLNDGEYAQLLADTQRRLLQDVKHKDNNVEISAAEISTAVISAAVINKKAGHWLLMTAAFGLLVLSIALYDRIGAATDLQIASLLKQSQGQPGTGQGARSAMADQLHAALLKGSHKKPDNLYYWVLLARLEQERDDFNAAAQAYQNALKIAPDDADVHAELAQVLFSMAGNRPTEPMLKHANKALAVNPNNASALGLLGIAAFAQQDYQAALSHWQAALQNTAAMSSSAEALRSGISRVKELLGEAVSDWSISLQVSLPAPLVAPAEATVFIYLREWQGMPMPLVAQRVRVADLPLTIKFNDAMALSPERLPSSISKIEVVARIAMSGNRQSSSGDLEGRLGPFSAEQMAQPMDLPINKRLP